MKVGWVAGSVRARLMAAERRLGSSEARSLAECATLSDLLTELSSGPYRRGLQAGLGVEEAQRAVAETTLLNLRILAGWLPRDGLEVLRVLAAWFELANLEDRLAYLLGGALRRPFELGSLAAAWPAAARAQTMEELRGVLSTTRWGYPGGVTSDDLRLGLRLAWARRVLRDVPEARDWAAGAVALLAARELFVSGRPLERYPEAVTAALGGAWLRAGTFAAFRAALPAHAAWTLADSESPDALWRAEAVWWTRVERDADSLMRSTAAGRAVIVGAVALLAADARRAAAVLGGVARRGLVGAAEGIDAVT
jgi:hypothetical protein